MALTPEQSKQEQDEFSAAFAGDEPKRPEQTEDEAFGITREEDAEGLADPAQTTETSAAESGDASGGSAAAGEAPAVAIVLEPGAEGSGDVPTDEEPMSEKDKARKDSWEGRLRAREAELKAREDALKAKESPAMADSSSESPAEVASEAKAEGETVAEESAEAPESAQSEALETAVEGVQSGSMTVDEAMKTLAADFGEEFPKMLGMLIEAKATEIANKTADEKVGKVSQNMDNLVREIVDDKANAHFERISDAHPDFLEVADSPAFQSYIDSMPEEGKQAAMHTIEGGSAKDIVKLIDAFKASQKAPEAEASDKPDESAMDSAEGVRSAGLSIPAKPAESQDYEEAWNQF